MKAFESEIALNKKAAPVSQGSVAITYIEKTS